MFRELPRERPGSGRGVRRSVRLAGHVLPIACVLLTACTERAPEDVPAGETAPGEPLRPHPSDGQGTVRLTPGDPVVASSWGSWTIEWVAGPSGLATDGGAALQVSPFWGWSPPQTFRPGAPGYTTASCSRPGVTLEIRGSEIPMAVVAWVAKGPMEPGDTLRFVYGDSARGGPGSLARADRYAEAFEELLIKTDGNGDGLFVAPEDQPTLRILPGDAVQLAVATRALVEPGRDFEVAVHALDGIGNRTDLPAGRWVILARRLATGQEALSATPDTLRAAKRAAGSDGETVTARLESPGLYRIEAFLESERGEIGGRNDLLLVEEDSPFTGILWGDIHCHSALSDGTGAPADLYAFARDVSGLDVCVVTDHDAHGLFPLAERGGWETVRVATRDAYEPGAFVTFLGYEWTNWTYGHRNVYYPSLEGEVFSMLDPESDSPPELWGKIAPYGAMTIAHHPGGGPVAQDWSVPTDYERERIVEICSIHGSSEAVGVERGIYRPVPSGMVRNALRLGHKLAFLAAGDTHDGHPGRRTAGAPTNGLAAFRTGERTRDAVWNAMRERRVYGTSGPRVLLSTDWDGATPGTELAAAPAGPLTVRVCAPTPVETVEIIGETGTLATSYGGGRRVEKVFFQQGPPAGTGWVYARIVLADGEMAWESPFWLPERD